MNYGIREICLNNDDTIDNKSNYSDEKVHLSVTSRSLRREILLKLKRFFTGPALSLSKGQNDRPGFRIKPDCLNTQPIGILLFSVLRYLVWVTLDRLVFFYLPNRIWTPACAGVTVTDLCHTREGGYP
jgi:hypothetical protein